MSNSYYDWVLRFNLGIPGVNVIQDTIVIVALIAFQTKKNHIEKSIVSKCYLVCSIC